MEGLDTSLLIVGCCSEPCARQTVCIILTSFIDTLRKQLDHINRMQEYFIGSILPPLAGYYINVCICLLRL